MSTEKENWYRTGAVAKALETSSHKIRELARAELIESQVRNGYRYFPGREVERLRNEGLPARPASSAVDETPPAEGGRPARAEGRPVNRSRLTQDLYAEPSRQLAKSKEKLVRLEHSLEAKKIQKKSREFDRAAQEERTREYEARMTQAWREGHLRRVVEALPASVCTAACDRLEAFLDRVPPRSNVTTKVGEIIETALRPIKRRVEQDRAINEAIRQRLDRDAKNIDARARVERAVLQLADNATFADMSAVARSAVEAINAGFVHRRKLAEAVRLLALPVGATAAEYEDARDLAREAVASESAVPVGAPDRQLQRVIGTAISGVAEQVRRRNAIQEQKRQEQARLQEQQRTEDDKRRQIELRRTLISIQVSGIGTALGYRATPAEVENAKQSVRSALEQLPVDGNQSELSNVQRKVLAPFKEVIEQREAAARQKAAEDQERYLNRLQAPRKADAQLPYIEACLRELEREGDLEFDDTFDRWRMEANLKKKLRPILIDKLAESPNLSDADVKRLLRRLVDEHHLEFCD